MTPEIQISGHSVVGKLRSVSKLLPIQQQSDRACIYCMWFTYHSFVQGALMVSLSKEAQDLLPPTPITLQSLSEEDNESSELSE